MKKCIGLATLLFAPFLLAVVAGGCGRSSPDSHQYEDVKELVYSFHVQNTTRRQLDRAKVVFYLPVPETSKQALISHQVFGLDGPIREYVDGLGNKMLEFNFDQVPPDFARTIRIWTKVGLLSDEELADRGTHEAGADRAAEMERVEQILSSYAAAGRGLESTDSSLPVTDDASAVSSVPEDSRGMEADGSDDEGLHQLSDSSDASVNGGLAKTVKSLGCIDQANLFADFALSYDVAARAVVGIAYGSNAAPELRCWPEVKLAGIWTEVDLDHLRLRYGHAKGVVLRIMEPTALQNKDLGSVLHGGYGLRVSPVLIESGLASGKEGQ